LFGSRTARKANVTLFREGGRNENQCRVALFKETKGRGYSELAKKCEAKSGHDSGGKQTDADPLLRRVWVERFVDNSPILLKRVSHCPDAKELKLGFALSNICQIFTSFSSDLRLLQF
jgi:hypothetical protein